MRHKPRCLQLEGAGRRLSWARCERRCGAKRVAVAGQRVEGGVGFAVGAEDAHLEPAPGPAAGCAEPGSCSRMGTSGGASCLASKARARN